jgi:hypothetical protein
LAINKGMWCICGSRDDSIDPLDSLIECWHIVDIFHPYEAVETVKNIFVQLVGIPGNSAHLVTGV